VEPELGGIAGMTVTIHSNSNSATNVFERVLLPAVDDVVVNHSVQCSAVAILAHCYSMLRLGPGNVYRPVFQFPISSWTDLCISEWFHNKCMHEVKYSFIYEINLCVGLINCRADLPGNVHRGLNSNPVAANLLLQRRAAAS